MRAFRPVSYTHLVIFPGMAYVPVFPGKRSWLLFDPRFRRGGRTGRIPGAGRDPDPFGIPGLPRS